MEVGKLDEKGTGCSDLPIATDISVNNRPLNIKTFFIYPTLAKGKNISREVKYIQKKFATLKIDLKCHKIGFSKSKKRRLRRKRQARARLNTSIFDLEKVAEDPVRIRNAEKKTDSIKNEKINTLSPITN